MKHVKEWLLEWLEIDDNFFNLNKRQYSLLKEVAELAAPLAEHSKEIESLKSENIRVNARLLSLREEFAALQMEHFKLKASIGELDKYTNSLQLKAENSESLIAEAQLELEDRILSLETANKEPVSIKETDQRRKGGWERQRELVERANGVLD